MTSGLWIRSAPYDLGFIFGGALLTLLIPVFASFSPALLVPIFFWGWLFLFEGSHFWATYSRTYLDSKFRDENRGVLSGSLLFFALPLLAVAASGATGDPVFMNVYGFFIFTWSLYHNTRQHYGFVALYSRKAEADPSTLRWFRYGIYLATFGPMAHFFLSYKLRGDFPALHASLAEAVFNLPAIVSTVSVLYLGFLAALCFRRRQGSPIAFFYVATCFVFYNLMFFVVAAREPFLPSPQNFAQTLMVVTIMNSLFHNVQYHAIVWHYSHQRYGETSDRGVYGLAKRINSRFPTYALAALGFSSLFALVFWSRSEIPFLSGRLGDGGFLTLAYVIYFGIVGHHFYLDQKIWRVSRNRELARYFIPGRMETSRV